ncbi:YkgJ family cysteine cluster protein [Desulfatitalea alkaliphila]|uniref:YkgJ family cysteine cluster protein n=1 Tax=Desulfatitalea alkaliphila TaxID=2929485 RepID=A0AA41R489_9BACT|nr:YkgJ family cysteine cluster protein [Desulfatitalea alkaliphila]MCJ8501138.1 YkgJ family cysteine cluster protein [Desulfatitalea alkaliphila]
MKYLDEDALQTLQGRVFGPEETFSFRCHPGVTCFNRCCHNLNLFLYPYDVLRLRQALAIPSDQFIDGYVDVVLRPGHFFPEVLLRMADGAGQPCIFLSAEGCRVYGDRPHTCRLFPMEQGARLDATSGRSEPMHIFRPPDFCQGPAEDRVWTVDAYVRDQGAEAYYPLTLAWAELHRRFVENPWGAEGPSGAKGRMAFMAAYNLDQFRDFVFQSSFLKRYKVAGALVRRLRSDDHALLQFGFEWIKVFVWGMRSQQIKPKK